MKTLAKALLIIAALAIFAPAVYAEPIAEPQEIEDEENQGEAFEDDEIDAEIERLASELKLEAWQSYFDENGASFSLGFEAVDEMLVHYAENSAAGDPQNVFKPLYALIKNRLSGALGTVASLTAAALITGIPSAVFGKEDRRFLTMALSIGSVLLTAGLFSSLCAAAVKCIERISGFCEACLPVMTVLMTASGSAASAGALQPMMLFISSGVVFFLKKVILPLIIAGAAIGIADSVCEDGRLTELVKLIQKAVKWLIGLAAAVFFGVCVIKGLTVSAHDGIAVRTAKYAADKLFPSAGGFLGGTADTMLGCAMLVKNGAGITAIIIMAGIVAKPLITIGVGALAFRFAAALSSFAADRSVVNLLSGAGETASCLFGATAIAGAMFMLTILVFLAAGGVSAGLW